ncbi:hypothetical protein NO113_19215, partial [Clostridioides difficile]|nr:hypothetical protein [Clostridioides difficile]
MKIVDRNGALAQREIRVVSAYGGAVELGPYRHFMQQELFEQPRALCATVPQTDAFDATLFGDAAPAAFATRSHTAAVTCAVVALPPRSR